MSSQSCFFCMAALTATKTCLSLHRTFTGTRTTRRAGVHVGGSQQVPSNAVRSFRLQMLTRLLGVDPVQLCGRRKGHSVGRAAATATTDMGWQQECRLLRHQTLFQQLPSQPRAADGHCPRSMTGTFWPWPCQLLSPLQQTHCLVWWTPLL